MPEEEPIVVLETKIQLLLEAVRHLKEDNVQLREQMKPVTQQLSKKQTEASRWAQDRNRVEAKVRKLLVELDTLAKSDGRN
jgi:FtsZ-binding cell division protein ZapB